MTEAPTCPEYVVEGVDEHNGKPCVLIHAGVYYLLTNIDVRDDEIEYDLAVGRGVAGGAIEWLDDSDVEGVENHGMIADLIIADVIQTTSSQ